MRHLEIVSIFFVSFLSFVVGGLSSLMSWTICLYLVFLAWVNFDRITTEHCKSGKIVLHCYIIISILGYFLTIDNLSNFGTQFGFAVDDGRYFDRVVSLAKNYAVKEYGLFEKVFSAVVWILENTIIKSVDLSDILPFIWIFAAISCYLCHRLACIHINKEIPSWIIYFSLILNYNFIDSTIRFYRESFLYCFYILGIIFIYDKKYTQSLFFIIISGVIRGANAFLLLTFFIFNFLKEKIKNSKLSILAIFAVIILTIYVSGHGGAYFLNYATDYSRVSRYQDAFSGYSLKERIIFRQQQLTDVLNEESVTAKIYRMGGAVAFFAKPVVSMFFPLTFEPFIDTKTSNSDRAARQKSTGFYFFNIYRDISILSWVFVFPLLTIGLVHCLSTCDRRQILGLFFLFCLFLVANLSGQLRHGLAFIVLIPCFVANGWEICRSSSKNKQYAYLLATFMCFFIFSLNILKYL